MPKTGPAERRRISDLHSYGILDTPRERAYDEIAALAASLTACSTAFVAFSDDSRQWVKAGVNVPFRELPKQIAISQPAMEDPGGILVVPDTLDDERLAAHPFVTGAPFVRFVASVPVKSHRGLPIGTVTVADTKPRRDCNVDDVRGLTVLAGQVQAHLEARRAIASLKNALDERQQVERVKALGIDRSTGLPSYDLFLERLRRTLAIQDLGVVSVLLAINVEVRRDLRDAANPASWPVPVSGTQLRACLGSQDSMTQLFEDRFLALTDAPESVTDMVAKMAAATGVPVSVGATVISAAYERAEDAIVDADVALRIAQDTSAQVVFFDVARHAALRSRQEIQIELRDSIERNAIPLAFQPIVNPSGDVVAYEALLRWARPSGEQIPPEAALYIAARCRLLSPLFDATLDVACRWFAEAAADSSSPIRLHVNADPRQLAAPGFSENVFATLARHGIPAHRLALEITESTLVNSTAASSEEIRRLRAAGVRLEIDDFGTGYSSLSRLADFAFDGLKIDRSFVARAADAPRCKDVLGAIVSLAHRLGLEVTAEGIESAEQLELVRAMGCEAAQGWHVGEPQAHPVSTIPTAV